MEEKKNDTKWGRWGGPILGIVLLWVLVTAARPVSGAVGDIVFNEVMVSNGAAVFDSNTKNFSDWLELYNTTGSSIDLNGYWLSDDPSVPKQWEIKNITINAHDRLLFWADGLNYDNHTNFKLKHGGEILILSNPSGAEVARLNYTSIPQLPNVSYGRTTDGGSSWAYFSAEAATPNQSNNAAVGVPNAALQPAPPLFNLPGGFYSGSQTISLSLAKPITNAQIRYTLDGSIPTSNSNLYTGSFSLSANGNVVAPSVRARVFAPGYLPSEVATHTYFLNAAPPSGSDLWRVSITTNPAYFFDDAIGIYVPGNTFDAADPDWTGNYFEDWERPMHIEVFEPGADSIFAFDGGAKINGNASRRLPIKTLHIKTGSEYGSEDLRYQIFETIPIDDFSSFVLRSSGNDQWSTMFRDGFLATLAHNGGMNLDVMAYRPAVIYINGQYWGIQNFREKLDEVYFQEHYGTDVENLDLLSVGIGAEREIFGSKDDYEAMVNFARNNNMASSSNYAQMQTLMDVDNFIDYMAMEIFIANTDWPDNNVKMWRDRAGANQWRWFLFDLDAAFDLAGSNKYTLDTLQSLTGSSATNWPRVVPLFNNLLANQQFKNEFVQTFAAHLNITFEPNNVVLLIDEMQERIAADMVGHVQRWTDPSSMSAWRSRVNNMRNFANQRPDYMWSDLETEFGLARYRLNIENLSPGRGQLYVQDVLVPTDNFNGDFFQNVPVRLRAKAAPGYRFVRWQDSSGSLTSNPELTINRNSFYRIEAVFEENVQLVINEIHYNPSADLQGVPGQLDEEFEFVELYNPNNFTVDMAGFSFTEGFTFTFPSGANLPAFSYLIVARNASAYSDLGVRVYQWESGGLNNSGETIALADNVGNELDVVSYDDGSLSSGWPTAADGSGVSLELVTTFNNDLPSNWESSNAIGGTPGHSNDTLVRFHPLVINEIYYKPPTLNNDDNALEFVELVNKGYVTLDLSGYEFTDGIEYTFPAGTTIAINECIVVVKDISAYASLVGKVKIFQWDSGKLSDDGELLRLIDSQNKLVDALIYKDIVVPSRSLELLQPLLDNVWMSNWEGSKYNGGTPCRSNTDDEAAVTLSATPTLEGTVSSNVLAFNIQLSYPMGIPVAVEYTTADGTATAGEDYQPTAGTLNFAPRQTVQTVYVSTIPDTIIESDETVRLLLSNPQALRLVDSSIEGVIGNDDGGIGLPSLFIAHAMTVEGDVDVHAVTVTVTLSHIFTQVVTVDYTTADLSALAGEDYQAVSGQLVFMPGETQKTIAVTIMGDTKVELDESLQVSLSKPGNATLANTHSNIVIFDDDGGLSDKWLLYIPLLATPSE